jgi:hypothetical protein
MSSSGQLSGGLLSFVFCLIMNAVPLLLCHLFNIHLTHIVIGGTSESWELMKKSNPIKYIMNMFTRFILLLFHCLPDSVNKGCLDDLMGKSLTHFLH